MTKPEVSDDSPWKPQALAPQSASSPRGPLPLDPGSRPAPGGPTVAKPAAPLWLDRVWPRHPDPAPAIAVVGVAVCVIAAAFGLLWSSPGLSWPVIALVVAMMSAAVRHAALRRAVGRRPADPPVTCGPANDALAAGRRWERRAWAVAALALVAVGAIRADGGLFTWCVLAAIGCGSIALAGGRSVAGLGFGASTVAMAFGRALAWWVRGLRQMPRRSKRGGTDRARLGLTVLTCAVLLFVFGLLFSSADGAFAHLLATMLPSWHGASIGRVVVAIVIVAPLALSYAYLAHGTPVADALPAAAAKRVRRIEWAVPVGVLNGLFALFVGVQVEFLFGGRQRVLRTSGLTYAQYARSGFWQLLVVVALTVVVIGLAARVAPRADRLDRTLIRSLLGCLCGLTLVIVASALDRLRVYADAYGFTRERVAVGVAEAWLGLVFLLILGAGLALRGRWVPRAAAGAAVAALLAVAIANPDGFIARHDVDRYQRTGQIDVAYLSGLSADAVPALERLPPAIRACVLGAHISGLTTTDDGWRSWNLDRRIARHDLLDTSRNADTCP